MNNKLIQGLLLASAICLLFGIALTVADVMPYRGVPEARPARRPTPPRPKPEPPAPEPAAQLPMLRLAPEGTWAVIHFSGARLAESPMVQGLQQQMGGGQDPGDVQSLTMFVLPQDGPMEPGARPEACGVAELRGQALAQVQAQLEEAEAIQIAGLTAYRMEQAPPMGMPMAPAAAPGGAFASLVDESTLLLGTSEAAFGAIAASHASGAGAPAGGLARTIQPFAGGAFTMAFHREGGLADLIPQEQAARVPAFLAGASGGGLGVALEDGVQVKGMLMLADEAAAEEAASKANAKLSETRQQMEAQGGGGEQAAQMVKPLTDVLDAVEITARGSQVHLSVALTAEQLQALPMMMFGMMPGMQGGPSGPPTGPPPGFGPGR